MGGVRAELAYVPGTARNITRALLAYRDLSRALSRMPVMPAGGRRICITGLGVGAGVRGTGFRARDGGTADHRLAAAAFDIASRKSADHDQG